MLVLTRDVSEEIVINGGTSEEIVITIIDVRNGRRVRVGVTARPGITVHRREVQQKIDRIAAGAGADAI